MGDPKFPRRTYDTPSHPWKGERIKEETELVKQYGLKNKRELWKAKSIIRNFRRQSRNLQARIRYGEEQAKFETKNLLTRCGRMGLLPMDGSTLDDVLGLGAESILNRRLQTLIFNKGLSGTVNQARQYIVHGHISVAGRMVTIPGYLVSRAEEDKIEFNPRSPISDDQHPMRMTKRKAAEATAAAAAAKEEKLKIPKKILKEKEIAEVVAEKPGEDVGALEFEEPDSESKEGS